MQDHKTVNAQSLISEEVKGCPAHWSFLCAGLTHPTSWD